MLVKGLAILFAIVVIAESQRDSPNAGYVKNIESEDGDRLAAFFFEQFGRNLSNKDGEPLKRLEKNGLILIKGVKFRTATQGKHSIACFIIQNLLSTRIRITVFSSFIVFILSVNGREIHHLY